MIKKRSVRIKGHPTSITLEEPFWITLKKIAKIQNRSLSDLITHIDQERYQDDTASNNSNLSSVLRCYVLMWYEQNANS